MTGTITLSDGGQDYIEFYIVDNVITGVRPSGLSGWIGTRILNQAFFLGDQLVVDLQWNDYDLPLKYPIVKIDEKRVTTHKIISFGTATSTLDFHIVNEMADFIVDEIKVNDIIANKSTGNLSIVTEILNETTIEIKLDIIRAGDEYVISRPV